MNVVFVAPYFGANMVHCIKLLAGMDIRLGVISHQPIEGLPPALRKAVDGHYRIKNALDASQLAHAVQAFAKDWGKVDRLIAYLEQLQIPVGDARDATGIPGMTGSVARNFRDKNRMKRVLREAGVPVARQQLVRNARDGLQFTATVGYPVVLKPLDGMGSKATLRVNDENELFAAMNQLMPREDAPVQCEEFVTGEEHTCETVLIDGTPTWRTSTYYLPGPLAVLENPWMQYCVLLPREEQAHVKAFAPTNTAALRALGMDTGLSHMEWFLRRDGTPVVSEVGARPPGVNIMPLNSIAAGHDAWAEWLNLQVFGTWAMPERRFAVGSAFLRGQGRGRRVSAVHHVDAVTKALGSHLADARWPKVGQVRSSGYEGEGWAIVKGNTTDEAIAALKHIVTTVRIEMSG